MPSPSAFRKGFGLDDLVLKNFKLRQAPKVGHQVVKTYKMYHFPIQFQFDRTNQKADSKALLKELQAMLVKEKKTILSDYGNPYLCYFDRDSFKLIEEKEEEGEEPGSHVTISCLGIGEREHKEKKKEKTPEEIEEDNLEVPDGYRMVKSHFNTGVCATCHKPIEIGRKIVQKKGEKGWSHLSCIVHNNGYKEDGKDEQGQNVEEKSQTPKLKKKTTRKKVKHEEEEEEEE